MWFCTYCKWPNLCSKTAWIILCTSLSAAGSSALHFPSHLCISNHLSSFPTDITYRRPGGVLHLADFDRGHGSLPSGHQRQQKRIFLTYNPRRPNGWDMASCSGLRALYLNVCSLNVLLVPGEDMEKKDALCLIIFCIKPHIKSELFSSCSSYMIRRDRGRSLRYKAEV